MKTNFYGFIIALLLNATIAMAYPGVNPFTSSASTTAATAPKASVEALQCTCTDKRTQLTWSVNNNEVAGQLELERSINGSSFKTVAIIFTTEDKGTAEYAFRDPNVAANSSYRVKIIDKKGSATYSTVVSR
ncbi:MAG: hypothetical protein ABW007_08560 [Chitinophagaceae bacterium]